MRLTSFNSLHLVVKTTHNKHTKEGEGNSGQKIQQPTNEKTQESKTKSKTQANTFPIYIYIYTPIILYPVMADSVHLFVLLECAVGYALFDVYAMEEIGGLLQDAMDTVTDLQQFGHAVKLQSFQPFSLAAEALENANAISEHALSQTLYDFLELNLPNNNNNDQEEEEDGKKKKKKKTKKRSSSGGGPMSSFSLGVLDPAMAWPLLRIYTFHVNRMILFEKFYVAVVCIWNTLSRVYKQQLQQQQEAVLVLIPTSRPNWDWDIPIQGVRSNSIPPDQTI